MKRDPKVVYHLISRWTSVILTDPTKDCTGQVVVGDVDMALMLSIPFDDARKLDVTLPIVIDSAPIMQKTPSGLIVLRWQLRKLGPGVWNVHPSVRIPNTLFAYVTLVDVPEPAPWIEALKALETKEPT